MKLHIFFILIFLFSFQSFALEREIVILTSIENPKNKPFWRSKSYEITQDIEKQYEKYFNDSGYKLVFVHGVNQETLSKYLTSDKTLALFWISHAADSKKEIGLQSSSIIKDIYGNNVKNIFQKINPNIKFISVVGCETKKLFRKFKEKGYYHSGLILQSFDKKIGLNEGIYKSVKKSAVVLDKKPQYFKRSCHVKRKHRKAFCRNKIKKNENISNLPIIQKKTEGIEFLITNNNPDYSAILTINKEFVGVLKKGLQVQSFFFPKSLIYDSFKLKVTYEVSIISQVDAISALDIVGTMHDYDIKVLRESNGNIFGLNENYYYLNMN